MLYRPTGLWSFDPERATPGFTVVAPLRCKDVHLIGMHGEVRHSWQTPTTPGNYAYMLPGGHLLWSGDMTTGPNPAGGQGGLLREYDWDGNIVWEHVDHLQHHDFRRKPNGNTVYAAWVKQTDPEIMKTIPGGIEGQGADDRQAGDAGAQDGGFDLFARRHGLDPENIGATLGKGACLLGEGLDPQRPGQDAQRLEQLAGRPHVAGHHNRPAGGVGGGARHPGRRLVEFVDAVVHLMQLETIAGSAEGVGQDDVGAGLDEAGVDGLHTIGVLDIPQLRRAAGLEAGGKQAGPHAAVGDQAGPAVE